MTCDRTSLLLDAYIDNELDVSHIIEVEQHLRTCAACSQAVASARILSDSLKSLRAEEKPAPDSLRNATLARLRKADGGQRRAWLMWSMIPAVAAAIVLIGLFFAQSSRPRAEQGVMHEVMMSHVRSLMPNHLFDIASTDQHSVKPWFAGKIDYSPPVRDLQPQGFPLVGGRLDYIGSRPVAVLVYQRRRHVINCYVWPEQKPDTGIQGKTENGYHIDYWRSAGMEYWVISDLNDIELRQFVNLLRASPS